MTSKITLAFALSLALLSGHAFAQSDPNFQSTDTLCEPDENDPDRECLPHGAQAAGIGATASGDKAKANGHGATANGSSSNASANNATATGAYSNASGEGSTATGHQSHASGIYSTATGYNASASGRQSTATGETSNADGELSTATGGHSNASGYGSTATGGGANAQGEGATAIGLGSEATSDHATALGSYSKATAKCTALGQHAECHEDETASFGSEGKEVRIVHLKNGVADTDAVNMGQVRLIGTAFGGGSMYDNAGNFVGPDYVYISGARYNNVGDGLYDLDRRVHALEQNPGGGGQGPQGPQGPQGEPGSGAVEGSENITVEKDGDLATVKLNDHVLLSEQGSIRINNGPSMSSNGIDAGNRRITNVSNGRIERGSMDAVNGGQLWEMDDRWNDRWEDTNRNVERVGAQAAALTMMAGANAQLPVGKVALNAAWGQYGNQAAFAVGAKVRLTERSSMAMGLSFAGGKAMGGIGYSIILD